MIIEQIDYFKNGTRIVEKDTDHYIYYPKICPYCSSGKRLAFYCWSYRWVLECPSCGSSTAFCTDKEATLNAPIKKAAWLS